MRLFPQRYNDTDTASCGDCDWTGPVTEVGGIEDADQRLCAGDPLPAGECPDCGSLAYVPTRTDALLNGCDRNGPVFILAEAMRALLNFDLSAAEVKRSERTLDALVAVERLVDGAS